MQRSNRHVAETRSRMDLYEPAEIQIVDCCIAQGGTITFPRVRNRGDQILSAVDCVVSNGIRPVGVSQSIWREVLILVILDMDEQGNVTFGRRGKTMRMAPGYQGSPSGLPSGERGIARKPSVGKGHKPQFQNSSHRPRFEPQYA